MNEGKKKRAKRLGSLKYKGNYKSRKNLKLGRMQR